MPELPEVETVRRHLARTLEGARIARVQTRRAGLRYPFPKDLANRLERKTIVSLARRAKYLLLGLEDDTLIISHLGMSGSWRVEVPALNWAAQKHDHLVMDVEHQDRNLRVTYHDPRRFGFILLTTQAKLDSHPRMQNLGVEPLGNGFSSVMLSQAFKDKKMPLKSALLDQRIIAGLGNIYVCEALWQAQLSPFIAAGNMAEPAFARLVSAIRDVLNRALRAGGSTLRDYVHIDGKSGYFQHQFNVYDRENAPCPRCGALILRESQSGRSTFYCAACQSVPTNAI